MELGAIINALYESGARARERAAYDWRMLFEVSPALQ
jgi:hypothetical protein